MFRESRTVGAMSRSPRHVVSFDGLRGLGALSVVCTHYALHLFQDAPAYPGVAGAMNAIDHTPVLNVIFAGYPWVNMFFVLSGFALSAMVSGLGNTPGTYLPYAINRVFRIYPVYFFAVLAAFVLQRVVYHGPIPAFGDWFNTCWTAPPTRSEVIDHAIMIGRFKTNKYVFVIWSLVHEMRISLAFPILYALVARLGIRGNLGLGAALLALDFTWATLADHAYLTANNYYFSFHYMLLFWAGSAVFQFRDPLGRWWAKQRTAPIAILGIAGFLLFNYGSHIDQILPPDDMRTVIVTDWLTGTGAVVFVVFALYAAPLVRFLSTPTMRFFGTISYSLYLAHGIVLLAVLHTLYGTVPLAILIPACAAVSVAISLVSFTVIEKPFMRFGKRLTART